MAGDAEPRRARAMAYVDGCSLYYGMCAEGTLDRCRWLDLSAIAHSLLGADRECLKPG